MIRLLIQVCVFKKIRRQTSGTYGLEINKEVTSDIIVHIEMPSKSIKVLKLIKGTVRLLDMHLISKMSIMILYIHNNYKM